MPKVIFTYEESSSINSPRLRRLGEAIRPLIAEALSTAGIQLTQDDVDWIPQKLHDAAIAPKVGIEIETIGYPDRVEKLSDREFLLTLKRKILSLRLLPKVDADAPLIWVKFVDPRGLHV